MDDSEGMTASRLITAVFSVMAMWNLKFPIGLGATMASVANSFYEGIITDPALMLKPTDLLLVTIIPRPGHPGLRPVCMALIPDTSKVDTSSVKNVKDAAALSKKDEICITVVFFAVVVFLLLQHPAGRLMNIMPIIGVLILIFTKSHQRERAVSP